MKESNTGTILAVCFWVVAFAVGAWWYFTSPTTFSGKVGKYSGSGEGLVISLVSDKDGQTMPLWISKAVCSVYSSSGGRFPRIGTEMTATGKCENYHGQTEMLVNDVSKQLQWDIDSQKDHYSGHVTGIRTVAGDIYIDLDGVYPNQLMTIRIPTGPTSSDFTQFGMKLPKVGDVITVSGFASSDQGQSVLTVDDYFIDVRDDTASLNPDSN